MKNLRDLEKILNITFKNKDLLTQALVHRSYLNENPDFKLDHNERLEFLGDAVLEIIVTEHLYKKYPNPEGELTNWRASLVNSISLAKLSEELGIEDFLYLSRGETKDKNSKARQYILANAQEAIIGAIYLDRGLPTARKYITKNIISRLPQILESKSYIDPKTSFQEAAQERLTLTPTYRVLKEVGPDHAKKFTIACMLGQELIAKGAGSSKQEAQVEAAKNALKVKGW